MTDTPTPDGTPSGPVPYGVSKPTDAELLITQRERASVFFAVMDAVTSRTKRGIIQALAEQSGRATNGDLQDYTTVTKRTLRRNLSALERDGIVTRVDGQVAVVTFPDIETRALAAHALECYYEQR